MITIAHRFSTLRFATRVIVMQAGKVVEEGASDELLWSSGTCAGLYRRQFVAL
jgi:ABC-type multidrug transport system fused ATPase/permease subunit